MTVTTLKTKQEIEMTKLVETRESLTDDSKIARDLIVEQLQGMRDIADAMGECEDAKAIRQYVDAISQAFLNWWKAEEQLALADRQLQDLAIRSWKSAFQRVEQKILDSF